MEDEGPTPLNQLVAYKKVVKIKVRKPKYPGMGDKYTSLHCILVDEKQQVIEASSDEMDYVIIVPKIEVGACYEIMNFCIKKTIAQCRVVPHDTHIMLTSKTFFKKLPSVFLPIPRHKFFLQDYNRLYPWLNKLNILTGNNRLYPWLNKLNILTDVIDHLYRSIRELITNEIWSYKISNVAHSFSALSLEQLPKPIIVVFTSLRVKLFAGFQTGLILLEHCLLPSKKMSKRFYKMGKSVNQAI
ncbi:hypothetical protein DVH24_020972 [Malus domestica]|uniref:Uncharacterized protein n=1 Tax=Malus domestica TaxID=3750 RepID=A0A498J829_MALDO|nr:hypothetical protein DVH24_020972 [Malus domestica]